LSSFIFLFTDATTLILKENTQKVDNYSEKRRTRANLDLNQHGGIT